MAFYYNWYGGPPPWRHWAQQSNQANLNHDPNKVVATGPQYPGGVRRDITSVDYPKLGPYDSHASSIVDRHLALTRAAGIDTLISSWWGPGSYEDQSLRLLLDRAHRQGSKVKISAYLETWALFHGGQFQPSFFADPYNFNPNSRAVIRQQAADWISYVVRTYGSDPAFLHTRKGSASVPVIFAYTVALFAPPEWQAIFDMVRAQTGMDVFYQGDVEGADLDAMARVFDGVHVYTDAPLIAEGDLSLLSRLMNPNGKVVDPTGSDPATVGADYQLWAAEARAMGKSWAATVIPGFDDRRTRNPSFVVSRQSGSQLTYDGLWGASLQSRPDWVLITSFNEWHEGTEIEPSVEYGSSYIARTRAWSDQLRVCRDP